MQTLKHQPKDPIWIQICIQRSISLESKIIAELQYLEKLAGRDHIFITYSSLGHPADNDKLSLVGREGERKFLFPYNNRMVIFLNIDQTLKKLLPLVHIRRIVKNKVF